MSAKMPVRLDSRDDVIWLAALLEGEGCFDAHRGKYARVRLAMVDRDVVGRAATLMGTGVRLTLRKAPNKPTFHAEVTGPNAIAIMERVLPHMGARRSARIAEVLSVAQLGDRQAAPGPKPTRPPGLPL